VRNRALFPAPDPRLLLGWGPMDSSLFVLVGPFVHLPPMTANPRHQAFVRDIVSDLVCGTGFQVPHFGLSVVYSFILFSYAYFAAEQLLGPEVFRHFQRPNLLRALLDLPALNIVTGVK